MYNPPAFEMAERQDILALIRAVPLVQFVTATIEGPMATALPLFLDETEGEMGTLYGHLARANRQWNTPILGQGLAIFSGPDAYVRPGWYAAKKEHGKVVPTWNYATVHATGPVEFFDDPGRLHAVVSRLTALHEANRAEPWAVTDAPATYIAGQLRGIVGLRMPISALAGKRKMSQNRSAADQEGVRRGLAQSDREEDRLVSTMIG